MLKRVRDKQAKMKAEEDEIAQRPNKAVCEREERMAEVQLEAYWACYPLHPSPANTESCKERASETGQDKDDGAAKHGSNTRKQLLLTLRSSIEAKGQAAANKMRYSEAGLRPANSMEGEDPKAPNREQEVEVAKIHLQQAEN